MYDKNWEIDQIRLAINYFEDKLKEVHTAKEFEKLQSRIAKLDMKYRELQSVEN